MHLQNVALVAFLAFCIFALMVSAGIEGWGETCVTSEDCDSILTCQKSFVGSNLCLCPGTLVGDSQNQECRVAPGDICEEESDCVFNAECAKTALEFDWTCKCIQGTRKNVFNECEKVLTFDNFAEDVKNFFSSLGTFGILFSMFLFGFLGSSLGKLCGRRE